MPVSSRSSLIQQTQWLPLVSHLVQVWSARPGKKAAVSLAHDANVTPRLWLELNQSGIEKLKAYGAARL